MIEPVYILIRTSGRPIFFKNMMQSIKEQTYKNIITIVHTDNDEDDYVEGDIIIKGEKPIGPDIGGAPYNLYCNTLLKSIPDDSEGWYHFMDDDDMYAGPDVIEKIVKASKKDLVNVAKSDRGGGNIWPKYWKNQKSFQTQCFFLHTDYKDKAVWWSKRAGDHYYSKQLTDTMSINWIDKLVIARAQEGKGCGLRADFGENQHTIHQKSNLKMVPVYYFKNVKGPVGARGNIGDIKVIDSKLANKLIQKKMAKFVNPEEYKKIIGG